jgi:hypothetical protein
LPAALLHIAAAWYFQLMLRHAADIISCHYYAFAMPPCWCCHWLARYCHWYFATPLPIAITARFRRHYFHYAIAVIFCHIAIIDTPLLFRYFHWLSLTLFSLSRHYYATLLPLFSFADIDSCCRCCH